MAVDYLVSQGFSLLATNLRVGALEIDVLARLGGLVVVAEVRTRGPSAFTRPLESVDAAKRERLVRAAQIVWREQFQDDPSAERLRFEVIAVSFDEGTPRVEHVTGAFTA